MSTRRTGKREGVERPWQRRESHDRFMWFTCASLTLGACLSWLSFESESLESNSNSKKGLSERQRVLPQELDQSENQREMTTSLNGVIEEENETTGTESSKFDHDDAPSLTWWIEAAPLPHPDHLRSCLAQEDQATPEILPQEFGFSILINGRERPQTIYEQRERIWVKTPLLKTAHQQAYDHLNLISCLQSPGATLHDPLLIRQWGGDNWPSRSSTNAHLSLEDLFVIRSKGEQHFTYGLNRLGLPELGLITSSEDARFWLRRLSLFWIMKPDGRHSLKSEPTPFELYGRSLTMTKGSSLPTWLGPPEVKLITDTQSVSLSTAELSEVFKSQTVPSKKVKKRSKKRAKALKRQKNLDRQKRKRVRRQVKKSKSDKKPKPTLPQFKYR